MTSKAATEARARKWKQQKKKSLVRMVPDFDSLMNHIKRANLFRFCKHYKLKAHPSSLTHGWVLKDRLCLPSPSSLPALPMQMPQLPVHESDSESINGVVTLRTAPTDRSVRSDLGSSEQFRRIDRNGRGIGRSGRGINRG